MVDPDGFEAALTACVAQAAPGPAVPAAYAAHREAGQRRKENPGNRKRKQPAAGSLREERGDGWFRPHPLHPWLDPAVLPDPGHAPARRAAAADGKERKLAKAGGRKKVHLLAAVTHVPGPVIAQDKAARAGKASEISRFKPLLAPLPLDDVLITADAMRADRDNAAFLRTVKKAHYLRPVPGSQPGLNAQLNALPWGITPAAGEISRGRIETRAIRVLPAPGGAGFQGAAQAVLTERYTTYEKKGQWHARAGAVLYLTSPGPHDATAEDLLAHVRGHWRAEHTRWLRDVIWKEDKSLIHTGNGPQVWSAITKPRHHPLPYTQSNQLHSRNPPLRSGPPPRTPATRPYGPLARLNTAPDFDESLGAVRVVDLVGIPPDAKGIETISVRSPGTWDDVEIPAVTVIAAGARMWLEAGFALPQIGTTTAASGADV